MIRLIFHKILESSVLYTIKNPVSWQRGSGPNGDGTYIKDFVEKNCSIPIKNYTYINGFKHKVWIPYALGVTTLKPLNLVPVTR